MKNIGFINGFVIDNHDPEYLGRVQVSFLMPGNVKERTEWARVAHSFASKGAGFHFIPEENDEVLLAFIGEDTAHPVVLGSLYNEEHPLPDFEYANKHNRDKKNTLRSIKTKMGLEVSLSEAQDDSFVRISDGDQQDLKIDRTKGAITVGDKSGNRVQINSKDSALEITDHAGNRMYIKDGKIEIEAKSRITLGAGGSHAVPLGDLLMQLFNAHIHNTGVGPSSVPTTPMTEQQLSQLSYTK